MDRSPWYNVNFSPLGESSKNFGVLLRLKEYRLVRIYRRRRRHNIRHANEDVKGPRSDGSLIRFPQRNGIATIGPTENRGSVLTATHADFYRGTQ